MLHLVLSMTLFWYDGSDFRATQGQILAENAQSYVVRPCEYIGTPQDRVIIVPKDDYNAVKANVGCIATIKN